MSPIEVYLLVLFTYFILNRGITLLMYRLERRLWPEKKEQPGYTLAGVEPRVEG